MDDVSAWKRDSLWLSDDECRQLLALLEQFFGLWEELHRVIPTGDQDKAVAASAALVKQAKAVREFYG